MKQTAVEFLQECISIHLTFEQKKQFEGLFQQAKEMEKEQIIDAYKAAEDKREVFQYEHRYGREYLTAEPYYTETYKK